MQNVDKILVQPVTSYRTLQGRRIQSSDRRSLFSFLKNILGLGSFRIARLCSVVGVLPSQPVNGLGDFKFYKLDNILSSFLLGRRLSKRNTSNILEAGRLKSYKYYRLVQGLPLRNQRTHTNANTSRLRDRSVLRILSSTAGAISPSSKKKLLKMAISKVNSTSGSRKSVNSRKKSPRRIAIRSSDFNVHFKSVLNNLYLTFTNKRGEVLFWSSTGTVGFKGSKRSNNFAARAAAADLLRRVLDFRRGKDFRNFFIFTKKPGISEFYNPRLNFYVSSYPSWLVRTAFKTLFKGLRSSRLFYVSNFFALVKITHNGLRSKKPRRV